MKTNLTYKLSHEQTNKKLTITLGVLANEMRICEELNDPANDKLYNALQIVYNYISDCNE